MVIGVPRVAGLLQINCRNNVRREEGPLMMTCGSHKLVDYSLSKSVP